jgi:hypothetical protein
MLKLLHTTLLLVSPVCTPNGHSYLYSRLSLVLRAGSSMSAVLHAAPVSHFVFLKHEADSRVCINWGWQARAVQPPVEICSPAGLCICAGCMTSRLLALIQLLAPSVLGWFKNKF